MDINKKREKDADARSLYELRVLVVGGGFQYIKMFFDAGFKGAKDINEADFICFTGGEDVSPSLYQENPIPGVSSNLSRDNQEAYIYAQALASETPMVGICRGAQFLNVMNGGRLWQDVDNHAIRGFHNIVDLKTGEELTGMTSTHHQQMITGDGASVLAMASLSTCKKRDGETLVRETPELDDVEVVWYQDGLSLCFQPHPEYAHGGCRDYFLDLVDEYVLPAC